MSADRMRPTMLFRPSPPYLGADPFDRRTVFRRLSARLINVRPGRCAVGLSVTLGRTISAGCRVKDRRPRSRRVMRQALVFDELAARVSRLDVVLVTVAVALAELLAEQDLPAAVNRTEIDQPLVGVLHVDAEMRDLEQERVDLLRDRIGGPPVV